MPRARSLIVAGIYIGGMVLPEWNDPAFGRTSRLYLSGYFLDVIEPLKPLARLLEKEGYKALISDSIREDSSVLPLKLAAVRAGLGWQGKHSLLINRRFGSYLALGGIITDAELDHNGEPEKNCCGSCSRCREACPMGALEEPFVLERAQCLSLILQTDDLVGDSRLKAGNRVGDCEICQDACPWNRKHIESPQETKMTLRFRENIDALSDKSRLTHLISLDKEGYRREWHGRRTDKPFSLFRRNVENAVKNSRD